MKAGLLGDVSAKLAADSEKIMPTMVMVLLHPLLAGILLSGAVSAMMSTASSQLMVASTAISEDFIESYTKHKMPQSRKLLINKILILVVGAVAFMIGISLEETPVSDIFVVSVLPNIKDLQLNKTQVSDISALNGAVRLSNLGIENTQVSDISVLAGTPELSWLAASGSMVSDLSALTGLEKLRSLYIRNTPAANSAQSAALEASGVNVRQ